MSHRLLVVVGGILAAFVLINCISPTSASKSARSNYRKLSIYLADRGTYGAAGYLKLAKEKYDSETPKKGQYVRDLRNLIRLEKILLQPTCDYDEFDRLIKVASYTGGYEYVENLETLSPVQSIVHMIASSRAHACRNQLLRRFNEAYGQLNPVIKNEVELIKDDLERPEDMDNQEYVKFLVAYDPSKEVNWNRIIQVSVDRLGQMSPHDQDGGNFDELYDSILKGPCSEYEATLGLILHQVDYDYQLFGGRVSYTDEEVPLFRALAQAKVCEQIDSDNFREATRANWLQQKSDN